MGKLLHTEIKWQQYFYFCMRQMLKLQLKHLSYFKVVAGYFTTLAVTECSRVIHLTYLLEASFNKGWKHILKIFLSDLTDLVTIALSSKVDSLSQKQFHWTYWWIFIFIIYFALNLLHFPTIMDHLKNLISWSKHSLHYLFRATLRNFETKTILEYLKSWITWFDITLTIKLQEHVK